MRIDRPRQEHIFLQRFRFLPQVLLKLLCLILVFEHETYSSEVLHYNIDYGNIAKIADPTDPSSQFTLVSCDNSNTFIKNVARQKTTGSMVTFQLTTPPHYEVTGEYEVGFRSMPASSMTVVLNGSALSVTQVIQNSELVQTTGEHVCKKNSLTQSLSKMFRGSISGPGNSNVNLSFTPSAGSIQLYSLRVFLQLCHPSCLLCSSDSPSDCTQCDSSATQSGGACVCPNNTDFQQEGVCVQQCNGTFFAAGQACFFRENCEFSDSAGNCVACLTPYILQAGKCVKACSHSHMAVVQVGNYLKCELIQKNIGGKSLLMHAFSEESFSSRYPLASGFTVTINPSITCPYFSNTSLIRDTQFVLGDYSGSNFPIIVFPQISAITFPTIMISFRYIVIDFSLSTNICIQIDVSINGSPLPSKLMDKLAYKDKNLCGNSIDDEIGIGYYQISTNQNGSQYSLDVQFSNGSSDPSVSIGIRDVYIYGMNDPSEASFTCTNNGSYFSQEVDCQECTTGSIPENGFCEPCSQNCASCSGINVNECLTCIAGTQRIGNTCQQCNVGMYYDFGTCRQCDTSCYQCQTSTSNCISCIAGLYLYNLSQCISCNPNTSKYIQGNSCYDCDPSCLTCSGTSTSCDSCQPGFYFDPSSRTCVGCSDSNCFDCSISPSTCSKCNGTMKFKLGTCSVCNTLNQEFISGETCLSCDSKCLTCTDASANSCITCMNGFTKMTGTNTCISCPILRELSSSQQNCANCSIECKLCSDINATVGYGSTDYCQYCVCTKCTNNLFVFLGQCVNTCTNLGTGLTIVDQTNRVCDCSSYLPVLITSNNNKYICMDSKPPGYWCPINNSSIGRIVGVSDPCGECSPNCETCSSQNTCSYCQTNYYFWKNKCRSPCFPSLSILENNQSRICECEAGKEFKKRNAAAIQAEVDADLRNEEFECLIPLKLEMIELINALSRPKSREGIPERILHNYFVLTYIRRPTDSEFASFEIYLMKDRLIRGKDYEIVNVTLESMLGARSVLVDVNIFDNRKINDIDVTMDALTDRILINNAVLISKDVSKEIEEDSSRSIADLFEDLTEFMTKPESPVIDFTLKFSKQFQFVCSLANFVQILTPIYLLSNSLPPLVKYGSLLGASFIFNSVPSEQSLEFNQESPASPTLKNIRFSQRYPASGTSSPVQPNKVNQEKYLLARVLSESFESSVSFFEKLNGFGLTGQIFDGSFIGVHVMVFGSVFLMIVCYSGRKMFQGKQYTMLLVDKLANIVTGQLQTAITLILSILAYSMSINSNIQANVVIYIGFYSIIYLQTLYLTLSKSEEYLKLNIPNFFIDLNPKVKGAKWYLVMSFCKKHIAIILLFTLYKKPLACCVSLASIYFAQGVVYIAVRFFSLKIVTLAKIIQEFSIATLFSFLAYTVKKYESMIENDIIAVEDIKQSIVIANTALIIMIVCIFLSFIFSTYRMVLSFKELVEAYRKYRESKQKVQLDETILEFSSIEMQAENRLESAFKNSQMVELPDNFVQLRNEKSQ